MTYSFKPNTSINYIFTVSYFLVILLFNSAHSAPLTNEHIEKEPIFNGDVYVREFGSPHNDSVVLIHGLGGKASLEWDKTINALKDNYHIITFDLPGFGKSSKTSKSYTPTQYASLIRHITTKYSNLPFNLIGHSMGGAISLKYASTYPEDIKTLTLVDAAGILHRVAYTKFLTAFGIEQMTGFSIPQEHKAANIIGAILSKLEHKLPIDSKQILETPFIRDKITNGNPSITSGLDLVLEDFRHSPQSITAPTLIIWGEQDKIAPLRTGYVLDALIQDSSLKIIENAGHVPITNNFDDYIRYVLEHLNKKSAPPIPIIQSSDRFRKNVSCNKEKNKYYTGHIGTLDISRCKQVLIEDAHIENLIIKSSQVDILNSVINSKEIALFADRSTIEITAGEIIGEIGIKASGTKFDIAGTTIKGRKTAIESRKWSNFIFSLTTVDTPESEKLLKVHGLKKVSYKKLFIEK